MGDAAPIPTIVKMDMPNPEPKSENVKVHDVWKEEWKDIDNKDVCEVSIDDVLEKWKK